MTVAGPGTGTQAATAITRKDLSLSMRRMRWQVWGICAVFLLIIAAMSAGALLLIPASTLSAIQAGAVPEGAGEADFVEMLTPILIVGLGFVIGFLGLKRLEHFDMEIEALRASVASAILEERKLLADDLRAARLQIDKRFDEVRQDVEALVERYATALLSKRQKGLEERLAVGEERAERMIRTIQEELTPYSWLAEKADEITDYTGVLTMGNAHERVTALYADGKADAAVQVATYAVENQLPGSTDDFHNLGSELTRRDQDTLAVKIADLGLQAFPDDVDLLSDGVEWSSQIGDTQRAEELYNQLRSIDLSLWNWRAFTFAGNLLELTHRPEEAMKVYEEFRAQLPDDERGYSKPGIYYRRLGKYAEAVDILEKGLAACRRCSQVAFGLSEVYLEQGRYEKAIHAADRALESNAGEQPSVNQSAVLWNRALAQDALFHKELSAIARDAELDQLVLDLARSAAIDYRTSLEMLDSIPPFHVRGPQRIRIMKSELLRRGLSEEKVQEVVGDEPNHGRDALAELARVLNREKARESFEEDKEDRGSAS